jgi:hypothetical protein
VTVLQTGRSGVQLPAAARELSLLPTVQTGHFARITDGCFVLPPSGGMVKECVELYLYSACMSSWRTQGKFAFVLTDCRVSFQDRDQLPAQVKTAMKCQLVSSFSVLRRTLLHTGRLHRIAQSI